MYLLKYSFNTCIRNTLLLFQPTRELINVLSVSKNQKLGEFSFSLRYLNNYISGISSLNSIFILIYDRMNVIFFKAIYISKTSRSVFFLSRVNSMVLITVVLKQRCCKMVKNETYFYTLSWCFIEIGIN